MSLALSKDPCVRRRAPDIEYTVLDAPDGPHFAMGWTSDDEVILLAASDARSAAARSRQVRDATGSRGAGETCCDPRFHASVQAAAMIRLLVAIGLIGAIAYVASPREFRQLAGRVEAEARSATATVSHFAHRVPTASQRLHPERSRTR